MSQETKTLTLFVLTLRLQYPSVTAQIQNPFLGIHRISYWSVRLSKSTYSLGCSVCTARFRCTPASLACEPVVLAFAFASAFVISVSALDQPMYPCIMHAGDGDTDYQPRCDFLPSFLQASSQSIQRSHLQPMTIVRNNLSELFIIFGSCSQDKLLLQA